jgi:FkbM family methyltransferase
MNIVKKLALKAIATGMRLPHEQRIDRISELIYLRDLIQRMHIDCVLDVGANRGQFARELRSIGFAGRIFSFEPIPSEFSVMKAAFHADANWIGYQLALGSQEKILNLNIPKLTVMSSLLESVATDEPHRVERVEVKRLDQMLPQIINEYRCRRFLLKMDTQGYDLEVFRGLGEAITYIHAIQSELSIVPLYKNMPHYLDALQTYERAGFDLFNLSVVNRLEGGALLELNCFLQRTPFAGN